MSSINVWLPFDIEMVFREHVAFWTHRKLKKKWCPNNFSDMTMTRGKRKKNRTEPMAHSGSKSVTVCMTFVRMRFALWSLSYDHQPATVPTITTTTNMTRHFLHTTRIMKMNIFKGWYALFVFCFCFCFNFNFSACWGEATYKTAYKRCKWDVNSKADISN